MNTTNSTDTKFKAGDLVSIIEGNAFYDVQPNKWEVKQVSHDGQLVWVQAYGSTIGTAFDVEKLEAWKPTIQREAELAKYIVTIKNEMAKLTRREREVLTDKLWGLMLTNPPFTPQREIVRCLTEIVGAYEGGV
jgi:hypothetical protein